MDIIAAGIINISYTDPNYIRDKIPY
jgi:hypothetical protein